MGSYRASMSFCHSILLAAHAPPQNDAAPGLVYKGEGEEKEPVKKEGRIPLGRIQFGMPSFEPQIELSLTVGMALRPAVVSCKWPGGQTGLSWFGEPAAGSQRPPGVHDRRRWQSVRAQRS